MCENKKNITFCTCKEQELKSTLNLKMESFKIFDNKEEYNKRIYHWKLEKTVRELTFEETRKIMGQIIRPSKRLDQELTAEFVVDVLNTNAEFDFEYSPEDGDELLIGVSYKYPQVENHSRPFLPEPMTFVYENKEWYFGYIDHFRYKQIELKKGNITLQ
ncbi:hypothetical protein LNP04_00515 [Chryseobacterium sp. C-71]|uniref:hypothetical protein n=1 Tax=Chryseobacterium sp. C-71 TaxID=2893882 RepID=UPI001E500E19|nr:hypothetical protein [Chryseobacterium sp. C-71]UFH32217.1 hypothetical protein LNP04_00515 [Chryseobacterium sp. C-71]